MAKYLSAFGWDPIIVRADEKYYTEALDPALANLVPVTVKQVRTKPLPVEYTRLFGVGDIGLRGWFGYRAALDQLARDRRVQAVLITGSPFYPMLLAQHVRKNLRLPVVLDFQDPWVSQEGKARPTWSKGRMSHRLAVALEPLALRHADFVTSVSQRQNDDLADRYAWVDRARMAAIPIGGDPDDFDALREHPIGRQNVSLAADHINLVYVGTFLPRAQALIRVLFQALADLRRDRPQLGNRIRMIFVGTSNQTHEIGTHRIMPLAEAVGVSSLVMEHAPRVPFLEALSLLARADGLLMIGSDEPHYTASKIYPNLMSGTPYLSIYHRSSSAHSILSAAGGGLSHAFETQNELDQLRPILVESLYRLADSPGSLGRANPEAYRAYTARSVAQQFSKIFDELVAIGNSNL